MGFKDTFFSPKQTITCNGRLIDFSVPRVMGILNVTPDSFYDGGRYTDEKSIIDRVQKMVSEGADFIDVGAFSTRPGATLVSVEDETARLILAFKAINRVFPDIFISVDTFRADIAKMAVESFGVSIINDVSAGTLDDRMLDVAGKLKVPYIMMHMLGTPGNMPHDPQYNDVTRDILSYFADRSAEARLRGVLDIIVDPGFGFGKTPEQNYQLLRELKLFTMMGMPVLAGLSRKSMIYKTLGIPREEALNGTTVVNSLALANGASILRVHDVKEAVEAVKLFVPYRGKQIPGFL
jgi:dihydropteroate synthase